MEDQIKEAENAKATTYCSLMKSLKIYLKQGLIFCFISFLVLFSSFNKISAEEISWTEVANKTNGIQYIDVNSIKYNNKGMLSVMTKYSEFNPENKELINTTLYLMAIDCENRLFSKLPLNGDLNQVKTWSKPINDKLIKKTILNSCSY